MVWYGMVWCGMLWFAMVMSGQGMEMVWFNVLCCSVGMVYMTLITARILNG